MRIDRIRQLANSLKKTNIDAVLLGPSADLEYLTGLTRRTGHERFLGLFVFSDASFFYISPSLYLEEAKKIMGHDTKIYIWYDAEGFLGVLKQAKEEFDLDNRHIAVGNGISGLHLLDVQQIINADFVKGKFLVGELRMIKDIEEMNNLRKASEIIDGVVQELVAFVRPGLRERDIKKKIEELCLEKGAPDLSFDPIVASGPNGLPGYVMRGESRLIEERDIVILDLGCKYNGYCSDITRTFFIGEPSEKEKKIYNMVLEANLQAEACIQEGVTTAEEVDKKAREVIEKGRVGQYFTHRTGHGIGLDDHEDPFIVEGNKQVLKNGMAFSVEPGVYIPGEFGIRIEDIVIIDQGRTEILNKFSKREMIVI